MWLGHDEKRTANWYKHYDLDYLSDAMQATDNIIRELQAFCVLVPVLRANRPPKSHQGGVKLSAMYWKKMVVHTVPLELVWRRNSLLIGKTIGNFLKCSTNELKRPLK